MADFYGTQAGLATYATAHAYTIASGDQDAALLRASEYIDGVYGARFTGYRKDRRAQLRAWPRYDAYDAESNYIDPTTVPIEVENATYEAAIRELASPGSLSPDVVPGTMIKSVTVEGAVSVDYVTPNDVSDQRPVLTVLDGILAPLLGSLMGGSLVGVAVRR